MTFHWIRVQLAHITAPILLGNGLDMQIPGVLIQMADRDTWIVRNHVLVYSLDGFCVGFKPAHLWKRSQEKLHLPGTLAEGNGIAVDYCCGTDFGCLVAALLCWYH